MHFWGTWDARTTSPPLKEAELTSEQHRAELAHVARLSTMGELAASLAHELNQPLAAILGNAETAQKMLGRDNVDLAELRAICDDIVDEDHRATEVMRRMRALVKKEPPSLAPLDVQSIIGDVVRLLHGNAVLRHCRMLFETAPGLPPVMGNRIELQQVVLNLLVNAFDAMNSCPADEREASVRAVYNGENVVRVSVSDHGARNSPRGARTHLRPLPYNQEGWTGNRIVDQSYHHRQPSWPPMGREQSGRWRDVLLHRAGCGYAPHALAGTMIASDYTVFLVDDNPGVLQGRFLASCAARD